MVVLPALSNPKKIMLALFWKNPNHSKPDFMNSQINIFIIINKFTRFIHIHFRNFILEYYTVETFAVATRYRIQVALEAQLSHLP